LQRKLSIALGASVVTFAIFAGTWLTLNHFRFQYYNDSIEGPSPQTSPYWTIIRAQDILHWPIVVTALCAAVLLLFKIAQSVGRAIFHREDPLKR
jgi:hypothetical protein